jgi:hypothetical protein
MLLCKWKTPYLPIHVCLSVTFLLGGRQPVWLPHGGKVNPPRGCTLGIHTPSSGPRPRFCICGTLSTLTFAPYGLRQAWLGAWPPWLWRPPPSLIPRPCLLWVGNPCASTILGWITQTPEGWGCFPGAWSVMGLLGHFRGIWPPDTSPCNVPHTYSQPNF